MEDDVWEFEVKPSLDNRWGDFELPVQEPVVGVLVKEFEDLGMVGEPVPSAVHVREVSGLLLDRTIWPLVLFRHKSNGSRRRRERHRG